MSRLCIIPARGGSKRIPRKNIRDFLGKPIIAYSIAAARESRLFDEVMVSTDSEEIAGIARTFGAQVPVLRSPATSDDHATTLDVIREVLRHYPTAFDTVCCLYATAPLVTPDLLRVGCDLLEDQVDTDCVFPAVRFGYPVQRGLVNTDSGYTRLREPEHLNTRSQDLEPVYHDAGMFYCFRPEPILATGTLWPEKTRTFGIREMLTQDIDTEEDWRLAEFKYQYLHPNRDR